MWTSAEQFPEELAEDISCHKDKGTRSRRGKGNLGKKQALRSLHDINIE